MEGGYEGLRVACWAVGVLLALFGLDDLFVDLASHVLALTRRLTIYRRVSRASTRSLPRPPRRRMVILVPAWREAAVIGTMLKQLRRILAYDAYRVFVGTYPNDPQTAAAAAAADPGGRWLTLVQLAVPGPTTKAHCLNVLWHAVLASEMRTGERFEAIVLHDAEDMVHADELGVFNYLLDRAPMVQLPVVPLLERGRTAVAGHYLDEFAESHQKDLVVREHLAGGVPSAGVGCAFRRDAVEEAAAENGGHPFRAESLTEDYAIALTLIRCGRRSIFVRIPDAAGVVVATREYFPHRFRDAVRQKARWLIGIGLQAWERDGWPGSLGSKYMLWRDRKAIATALLAGVAYLLAGALMAAGALRLVDPGRPPALAEHDPLMFLFALNLTLMVNRALHRAFYVARIGGVGEGLRAVMRIPVGNAVNCAASLRALAVYARHRLHGVPLRWDKTEHRLPVAEPAE